MATQAEGSVGGNVVQAINRIFSEALSARTEEQLCQLVLSVAEDVTGASYSLMGEINQATDRLDNLAISARGLQIFADHDATFTTDFMPAGFVLRGLFGAVLNEGESLIANDPANHPERGGAPDRHPPIDNFLGVPLTRGGRTIGMIGLANRPGGFREWDRDAIEEMAPAIVQALFSKRAEEALRTSEVRYRTLFERMGQGYLEGQILRDVEGRAVDFRLLELNPVFERLLRIPVDEAIGRPIREVLPDVEEFWIETYDRIVRQGVNSWFEHEGLLSSKWLQVHVYPHSDDRFVALYEDVSERRRADRALRDNRQRLRSVLEGIPQLVWIAGERGEWTWVGPQWMSFTGLSMEASLGLGWLDALHPDDRAGARDFWQEAGNRGALEMEGRVWHAREGRYRWVQTRARPVRDDAGAIVEWFGTSTDIDDLRRLQERQQLLVAELQHRVRNILTIVRSVFSRTIEAGGPLEEISDHFKGRLDALARTQVVVTNSVSGLVDLENMIRDELLSVGVNEGPGVEIEGPDVALPARAAESLGLAIHELTTNAVKYGALKVPGARLTIRWTANLLYDGKKRLVLQWVEQGVPALPVKPSRQGFGTELIEEALPYRLGAETALEFRGGGVRCTIAVVLPAEETAIVGWRDE
ncbi:hypothetical protein GCM10011380_02640 [Sphingomonas metalli]|uniref:histidine kinase n=1 Tax=Sphingomonas metalli TaxID=1779358 RepID=A0A916SUK2_9SPHN|nr:GAF domain-containing protein [Sphingomonas metalli]GGB16622.1 hypothetical protein GCM10011380_02640 [Sphingomonas metalli]